MLKTILVAVDGSEQTHTVLLQATEIARCFKAQLHLVSVYDLNQFWATRMPEPVPDIIESLEAETKKPLEDAQQKLESWNVTAQYHFLEGAVIEQIALLAEEVEADLVVMGHHQASKIRQLLKGSAAKGLIDSSPCSVLIVREKIAPTEEPSE
ncbi:MAG: universal stress protein [Burkholderiales bacterium]|jgi:nucleotide-binding universal stress UspA family protein|nr:universal stress protein [Burkholderiales bacterium]